MAILHPLRNARTGTARLHPDKSVTFEDPRGLNWIMNRVTHVFVTFAFSFSCFGLWGMLNLLRHVSVGSSQAFPRFTELLVEWRGILLWLPLPVVAYCLFAVMRRGAAQSATPFLACTMSALSLVFFPVMQAVLLPCVLLMEQNWVK